MINEIEIRNIAEYVDKVLCISQSLCKKESCGYKEVLFRGQPAKNLDLLPRIGRNRLTSSDDTIMWHERNLIEMAKYKFPHIFHKDLTPIELLALLQHYEIPTRLLDVTENPFVALYFACLKHESETPQPNKKHSDGEVFVFVNEEFEVTNYPIINAIADSYRFASSTSTPLSYFWERVIEQPYFAEHLFEVKNANLHHGEQRIKDLCQNLLFVHAQEWSQRQQAQQGRYILFPNDIKRDELDEKDYFDLILKAIPRDHETIKAQIIIPQEYKNQILNDLALFGVTKATLFRDDISATCSEITRLFQKR